MRITTSRYTRALEEELEHAYSEIALLRAENLGLLNSILGIAGVPPISVLPGATLGGQKSEAAAKAGAKGAAGNGAGLKMAAPMRRRSWQQINRMLELESGMKKRTG